MSDWDYLVGDDPPNWHELADIAIRRAEAAEAERDRLRGELDGANEGAVYMKLAHDSILGDLKEAERERDRLREFAERQRDMVADRDRHVVRLTVEQARLRDVAVAADALLSEDRTSWSPEHEVLAAALANVPALDVSRETTDD